MTFEEFFKKKKIDTQLLKSAQPALFEEFVADYALMGEKSFDYTKKYWFNQLRRKYHTPEEVKAEKPKPEIAVEAAKPLVEETAATTEVKKGYQPKFKAAVKPVAGLELPSVPVKEAEASIPDVKDSADETTAPKLGFKPKFKAGVTPKQDTEAVPRVAQEAKTADDTPPKLGFKPKFKVGVTRKQDGDTKPAEPDNEAE